MTEKQFKKLPLQAKISYNLRWFNSPEFNALITELLQYVETLRKNGNEEKAKRIEDIILSHITKKHSHMIMLNQWGVRA